MTNGPSSLWNPFCKTSSNSLISSSYKYCNYVIGCSVDYVLFLTYFSFFSFIDATVEAKLLKNGLLVAFTAVVAVKVTIYSSKTNPLFSRSSSSLVSLLIAAE